MYESFFSFTERPFPTTPQLQGYFPSEQIENALQSIVSCVERGAGPALVIASTGTGKSTLVLKLQEHFDSIIPVAVLCGTNCRSPRSLLQNALFSVGLPYVDMDEGQMRLSLTEFFKSRADKGSNTLLIMDDADSLSTDLLEELLGFSSLTGQNGWCVPMVLIGSFRLEEALGSPRVASLNQRIATRCYIDAWSRSEVAEYIQSRMDQTRTESDEIFLPGAAAKISEVTGGIPRVVNQLCDHALVMAAQKEQRQIDEFSIEEAWSDLQRLPLPANHFTSVVTSASSESNSDETNDLPNENNADSIVEFGSLDDEPSEQFAASGEENVSDSELELESDPTPEAEHYSTNATSFAAAAIGGLAAGHLLSPSEEESPLDADAPSSIASVKPSYPEKAEAMELQRATPGERSESPSLTPPIAERDPGFLVPPATPDLSPTPIEPLESLPFDAPTEESAEHNSEDEAAIYVEHSLDTNLLGQPLDPLDSNSPSMDANSPTSPGYEPNDELPSYTTENEVTNQYELEAVEQSTTPSDIEFATQPTEELDPTNLEKLSEFMASDQAPPLPASALPPIPSLSSLHSPSEPPNEFNVNPFMEEFDEEEVVLERIVGMSAASSRVTQTVDTEEGKVLTDVLQIMEQQKSALHAEPQLPQQPVEPADETAEQEMMLETESATEPEVAAEEETVALEAFPESEAADQAEVATTEADVNEYKFADEDAFDDDALVEVGVTPTSPTINDGSAFAAIENQLNPPNAHTGSDEPSDAPSSVNLTTPDTTTDNTLPMGIPLEMEKSVEADESTLPPSFSHDSGFGDFDDAFNKALEANDMPTPGLHNPGFDQGEFTTMDMPTPDYDAPPMGVPRGQVTGDSLLHHEGGAEAGQFDDLFSRLRDDA